MTLATVIYSIVGMLLAGIYGAAALGFFAWMSRARHPIVQEEATHPAKPQLQLVSGGAQVEADHKKAA